jgi:type I restriction enzyme S subunit
VFGDLLLEPVRNGVYKKKEFHGRGQKIVNMGELFANDFISDQHMKRVGLNEKERQKSLLQSGDLLFARRSYVLEGSGKCSLVQRVTEETTFESSIIRARLDPHLADPLFYYYVFRSPLGRSLVASIATRTAVSGIRGSHLVQLRVPHPALSVQRKIASILSAYDDLIENNLRRIKILEEMAQALYREWFVEFRFPGSDDVQANVAIPAGWTSGVLEDLVHQERRSVKPSELDPATPYVGLEHIPRQSITLTEWGTVGKVGSTKLRFKRGEILFGKIRPYFHKVVVAPTDGVCSSDAIVIVPTSPEFFALVLCCVSSEEFVAHATQTSQGTKMPRANWDVLLKYPVAIAPDGILSQFNRLIEPLVDLCQSLMWRNRALRDTRDLLLPRLISGEFDVSELDIAVGEAA